MRSLTVFPLLVAFAAPAFAEPMTLAPLQVTDWKAVYGRIEARDRIPARARLGGTLVAFEIKGGKEAAFKFCNALDIIKISNNLGDAKTIATHPATTTHQRLPQPQKDALGITGGLIRLSVGLEDAGDLIAELTAALA